MKKMMARPTMSKPDKDTGKRRPAMGGGMMIPS